MNKNTISTRIQSRLNRKGIKIALGEIKNELSRIAADADNATDNEIDLVVQNFIDGSSTPILYEENISGEQQIKPEMVKLEAQSMGIVLDTPEITQIASNLNQSSDELHDSLDEIRDAIIAFVKYKSSLNRQKIDEVLEDVDNVINEEFNGNSQHLAKGMMAINQKANQRNTDFKSQIKSAISGFAIP